MISNRHKKFFFPSGLLVAFFLLGLCLSISDNGAYTGKSYIKKISIFENTGSQSVCRHHFQNLPGVARFSEMRHKRALPGNIYVHEPVITAAPFVYTRVIYNEFYLTCISEKNYQHPSLRGPPLSC